MPIHVQNSESCVEINPSSTIKTTIIWLHGLGADGHDFVPIVNELRLPAHLGVRFVFPHAPVVPVTINHGYEMRAWFDIPHPDIHAQIDTAGIKASVTFIRSLIQAEIDAGVAAQHILLAGFSQGAVIALITSLTHELKLGGVIALSGFLPLSDEVLHQASTINHSLPIFLAHGAEDMIVPFHLGEATCQALQQAGYPVSWHAYTMGHAVCTEEITDLSSWIQSVENKRHTTG